MTRASSAAPKASAYEAAREATSFKCSLSSSGFPPDLEALCA